MKITGNETDYGDYSAASVRYRDWKARLGQAPEEMGEQVCVTKSEGTR